MKRRGPMDDLMKSLEADREIDLPMDAAFYDRLHDKIMAQVEKTPMRPAPWYQKPRRLLLSPWKSWPKPGRGFAALALILLSGWTLSPSDEASNSVQGASGDLMREVDALVRATPEVATQSWLTGQLESEFLMDVSASSFENQEQDLFKSLWSEGRN